MKKNLIGILVILALVSLIGCQSKNDTQSVPNNVETDTKTDVIENENKVESQKMTDEEMYSNIINDYRQAINELDLDDLESEEKIKNQYELVNMSLLEHVARYENEGVKLTYSYYDIDKNGTNELLIGADGSLGAIYSYDSKLNKPVKIFFQDTLERGNLDIYDNGIILSEGSGGAALHYYEFGKINEDGISYKLLEAIEEEYLEENETPEYRNAQSGESLEYSSLDEIMEKYVADAEIYENIGYVEI